MATLYKLTNKNWETTGRTKWGPSVTHGPTSGKGELCGPGWLHAYTSLELALLMNPIHANTANPVPWKAEGEIEKSDYGLKVGTRTLTTICIVEAPTVTVEHRIRFGILCALEVYKEPGFVKWANDWLSGKDRSHAAADAAEAAAWAANVAATWAATAAAEAAAAIEAASWAAAASAVKCAARAVARAASAKADDPIDLGAMAQKAIYGD